MIIAYSHYLKNMLKMTSNILANVETAEKRLSDLRRKVEEIKKIKVEEKIQELTKENIALSEKIKHAKNALINLEVSHGKKQYSIPSKGITDNNVLFDNLNKNLEKKQDEVKKDLQPVVEDIKKEKNKVIKNKDQVKQCLAKSDNIIDIRKLDFRIGKIVEINNHPDADTLYVEKIDCGEEKLRTVVSGLVHHVPIEEMREKLVMVLCNLKPVKMRGVISEAMVMCASSPDKVEVLIPPIGAVPGDLVQCEGYPREPEAQLNPKKKIFETCAPDLKTNDEKIVCYKENSLTIPGKGTIVAPTLKGVNVK